MSEEAIQAMNNMMTIVEKLIEKTKAHQQRLNTLTESLTIVENQAMGQLNSTKALGYAVERLEARVTALEESMQQYTLQQKFTKVLSDLLMNE